MAAKTLYEITLSPTRTVEMMEMGTSEIFQADKTMPKGAGPVEQKVEYLRYCIVHDGKGKVAYTDLQGGPQWDKRFSMKETMHLCMIWNQIHEPDQDQVDGLGKAWRVKSGR